MPPEASAAARDEARCDASDTGTWCTSVVAAVDRDAPAPMAPCSEASPSRSTSSGSSSGRRNRSTAGYFRSRPVRSRSRTAHPVSTTRMPGFARLRRSRWPCRPTTLASAASRMAQVLMTTRSAASIEPASGHPAASRRPAISSESLLFIWQPRVQTKNRGRVGASGRNSVSRASSGASGSRGPAGATAGGTRSSTGSARDGVRSVMARGWYVVAGVPLGNAGHRCLGPPYHSPMELLTNPETWIALFTLTVLEIVLGIDNVIFISILVQRLPTADRDRARRLGLGLAMGMRICLLLSIAWIVGLTSRCSPSPAIRSRGAT